MIPGFLAQTYEPGSVYVSLSSIPSTPVDTHGTQNPLVGKQVRFIKGPWKGYLAEIRAIGLREVVVAVGAFSRIHHCTPDKLVLM
jgi:hypothetical protein